MRASRQPAAAIAEGDGEAPEARTRDHVETGRGCVIPGEGKPAIDAAASGERVERNVTAAPHKGRIVTG